MFHKYVIPARKSRELLSRIHFKEGDMVKTSVVHSNNEGYLDAGDEVTIIAVLGDKGYDIRDKDGNIIRNIGRTV